VGNIDHARNLVIRAQTADYWVGYLASALEDVIFELRAGA
jgi:hypothetical protein